MELFNAPGGPMQSGLKAYFRPEMIENGVIAPFPRRKKHQLGSISRGGPPLVLRRRGKV
ncbi:hypothetical protein V5F49_06730 [Xanthobacter sp. V3C-3]|uniref:hypothetical protein n=1 Tax=Xanthobacter lutulentifluminis TaxID=3119935 RepID=UPI00372876D1